VTYLLDTHIWLWSLLEPARLVPRVRRALGSTANELRLSPISVWEVVVLVEKGRIRLNQDLDDWVRLALSSAPLVEAPLTFEIARESRRVALPHQDPADRFLVATARVADLVLVTADERLIEAGACRVLANR